MRLACVISLAGGRVQMEGRCALRGGFLMLAAGLMLASACILFHFVSSASVLWRADGRYHLSKGEEACCE